LFVRTIHRAVVNHDDQIDARDTAGALHRGSDPLLFIPGRNDDGDAPTG
jgi:hypothetical protein